MTRRHRRRWPLAAPRRTLLCGFAFEVRVPLESSDVVSDEGVGFLARDLLRGTDLSPKSLEKVVGPKLHVVENFGNRIAVHEVRHLPAAVAVEAHVHGIGIAEEIVQVAEDFLICSGEEHAEDVRLAVLEIVQLETRPAILVADEAIDPSVRVAGDVLERSTPHRLLVEPMNRHDREELIDRPTVRERLEDGKI